MPAILLRGANLRERSKRLFHPQLQHTYQLYRHYSTHRHLSRADHPPPTPPQTTSTITILKSSLRGNGTPRDLLHPKRTPTTLLGILHLPSRAYHLALPLHTEETTGSMTQPGNRVLLGNSPPPNLSTQSSPHGHPPRQALPADALTPQPPLHHLTPAAPHSTLVPAHPQPTYPTQRHPLGPHSKPPVPLW